mgnify:CR=1 FL=1
MRLKKKRDILPNDQTLKFTASKDYSGPASITFTAVDGKRDKNDKVKIINSAVLTLPITVIGRDIARADVLLVHH